MQEEFVNVTSRKCVMCMKSFRFIKFILLYTDALTVIIVGNGHGDQSSNPIAQIPLGKVFILLWINSRTDCAL